MSDPTYINGIFVRERESNYGPWFEVSIDVAQLVEQAKQPDDSVPF